MPPNHGNDQPRIDTEHGTQVDMSRFEDAYNAPAAEATELPGGHPHHDPEFTFADNNSTFAQNFNIAYNQALREQRAQRAGHAQTAAGDNHDQPASTITSPPAHNRPGAPANRSDRPNNTAASAGTAQAWPEQPPRRTENAEQTAPYTRTERFRRLAKRLLTRQPDTNAGRFGDQSADFYTRDPRTGDLRVHTLTPHDTAHPSNTPQWAIYYPHRGLDDKIKTPQSSEKTPWVDSVETRRPEAELTDMLGQIYFADPSDRAIFDAIDPAVLTRAYRKVNYMHPATQRFDSSRSHMQRYGVIDHSKFPEVLAAVSNELHATDPYGNAVRAVDTVIDRSGAREYIDERSPFKYPFGVVPPTRAEQLAAKAEDVSMAAARQAGVASRAIDKETRPARRAAAKHARRIDNYLRGPDDTQRVAEYYDPNVDEYGYLLKPDKLADLNPYGLHDQRSPQDIQTSTQEARVLRPGRHRATPRRAGNHESDMQHRSPGRQVAGVFHRPRQGVGRHRR